MSIYGGFDQYVKLLLHGDGTGGSQIIIDETGKTVTANGNAQINTVEKKFGTGSILYSASGDYLSLLDSNDWYLGTEPFTIDYWIRYTSIVDICGIIEQYPNGSNFWSLWHIGVASVLRLHSSIDGSYQLRFECSFNPNVDTWYHIALVRIDNGNTSASWRIFINGISQTLTLLDGNWNGSMCSLDCILGIGIAQNYASQEIRGRIDEFRISKGIARWISNFIPPIYAYGLNTPRLITIN